MALSGSGQTPCVKEIILVQKKYPSRSSCFASRRLGRAITLLNRAGRQLDGASQAAPDRFNRDHLYSLATGLREFTLPLSRLASHLQRGGQQ